jgi:hypothetical protein
VPTHLGKAGSVKRGWTTVGDIGYLDDEATFTSPTVATT